MISNNVLRIQVSRGQNNAWSDSVSTYFGLKKFQDFSRFLQPISRYFFELEDIRVFLWAIDTPGPVLDL